MKVTVDGYPLELSVVGGSLIVVQNEALRGTLSLADAPADPPSGPVLAES
ncbi:hypothetical protein [Rhodococcoides fascians]|nr:hypothetical protein [Rhodococcus fascians]